MVIFTSKWSLPRNSLIVLCNTAIVYVQDDIFLALATAISKYFQVHALITMVKAYS